MDADHRNPSIALIGFRKRSLKTILAVPAALRDWEILHLDSPAGFQWLRFFRKVLWWFECYFPRKFATPDYEAQAPILPGCSQQRMRTRQEEKTPHKVWFAWNRTYQPKQHANYVGFSTCNARCQTAHPFKRQ